MYSSRQKLQQQSTREQTKVKQNDLIVRFYRMAKIYCHINQWDASVQYFAIFHAVKEIHNTKNTLTLAFILKNKRPCDIVCNKNICRATYDDCRATESLRTVTKNFSHTIKQLFHQYHKILALCNIKGELASSFSLNIARSQYFVVLMQ